MELIFPVISYVPKDMKNIKVVFALAITVTSMLLFGGLVWSIFYYFENKIKNSERLMAWIAIKYKYKGKDYKKPSANWKDYLDQIPKMEFPMPSES